MIFHWSNKPPQRLTSHHVGGKYELWSSKQYLPFNLAVKREILFMIKKNSNWIQLKRTASDV